MLLKTAILLTLVSYAYGNKMLVWEELTSSSPTNPLQRRRNAAIGYWKSQDAIFIYGGEKEESGGHLDDFFKFDMKTKAWTKVTSPPFKSRINTVFGSRGDYLYIAAGEGIDTLNNVKTYFNDLWRYDLVKNEWKQLETNYSLPKARYSAGGGINDENSNFVLTHGFGDEGSFSDCYAYDTDKPNNMGWQKEFAGTNSYDPRYPHARYQHSSAIISKTKMLIFGGCLSGKGTGGPCPSDDSWVFDLAKKEWTEVNRCSSPTVSSAMALLPKNGSTKIRVVLWGGNANSRTTLVADEEDNDQVAVFVEEDEEWKMKKVTAVGNRFPERREGHVMVTTKDGIVMFGGNRLSDSDTFLSDLWLLRGTGEHVDSSPDGRDCGRQYFSLIMLHGVFMFIGWSVFILLGVFTARYVTFLHPLWFNIHLIFQVLGVVFVLGGTICGIVSVPSHQHFKFAHSIFGYIIFVLLVQQPFNAILRPQPTEQGYNCGRVCWEMWHRWSGRVVVFCSLINITLGLFLAVPPTLVWALWLAYLGLWLIIFIIAEVSKRPFEKRLKRRARKPVVYDTSNPYRISKGQVNTAF